ncbi:MAG: DUF134 domain-containing protein [Firmicutes bacterium]|nr:DUF134 domain-containing protein [Bacillota bacterium]
MARTAKPRRICAEPKVSEFSPGIVISEDTINLTIDEFEAIRLIDHLGLTQEESSMQMNVARTTVQSIYDSARKKIADALVNGKTIKIYGGSYRVCDNSPKCCGKNCREHKCRHHMCHGDERKRHSCHKHQ